MLGSDSQLISAISVILPRDDTQEQKWRCDPVESASGHRRKHLANFAQLRTN